MHIIVLIGMAVGVDYSLFYLRRFREQVHAGDTREAAIATAAHTAGHSVLVSGTGFTLALLCLLITRNELFSAMGVAAALVVLIAMFSSITVLPAMVTAMARFIDRPRVPVLWRLTGREPRLMPALMKPVVRHPAIALLAAVIGLGALALPVAGMQLKNIDATGGLSRELSTVAAFDEVTKRFPSEGNAHTVVAEFPAGADVAATLTAVDREISARPDMFDGATSWVSDDARLAIIEVATPFATGTEEGRDSVKALREALTPETAGVEASSVTVVGMIADDMDFVDSQTRTVPLLIALVLGGVFIFMLVAYRSLALACITVVLNALSALASFGALALVFQGTWAEGILGFTSIDGVVAWLPGMLFVVLSGLSLDYHVFVLGRIKENAEKGMDARTAVYDGVVRTAGVVTSAAVVMVGVFAIFGALSFMELKQLGVGLCVAIALDATVIRILALPAAAVLMRKVLWWPGVRSSKPAAPVVDEACDTEDLAAHAREWAEARR
jgi:RND superfamily putative drug exporter